MKLKDLNTDLLREAVRVYLDIAYEGGEIPEHVMAMANVEDLDSSQHWTDDDRFEVEKSFGIVRYFLRLGNRYYPHMKLGIVECSGSSGEFVFSADTHDRHFALAADTPGMGEFQNVQKENSRIKKSIESAWRLTGIPTETEILNAQSILPNSSSENVTVMIVDDTPNTIVLESIILKNAGFSVIECEDGYEAIKQAESNRINVCVMDVMMPGLDGYQTIERIRETRLNEFPILIASAAEECNVKKEYGEDFIAKPFSPRFFLRKIKDLLVNQNEANVTVR